MDPPLLGALRGDDLLHPVQTQLQLAGAGAHLADGLDLLVALAGDLIQLPAQPGDVVFGRAGQVLQLGEAEAEGAQGVQRLLAAVLVYQDLQVPLLPVGGQLPDLRRSCGLVQSAAEGAEIRRDRHGAQQDLRFGGAFGL